MVKTITIMGIPQTIIYDDFCQNPQGMGRWVEDECKIYIKNTMPPEQQEATLWHEVTHAVLRAVGENELHVNEDFVEKLARAYMQCATLKISEVKHV